jgi:hypothetical protein
VKQWLELKRSDKKQLLARRYVDKWKGKVKGEMCRKGYADIFKAREKGLD